MIATAKLTTVNYDEVFREDLGDELSSPLHLPSCDMTRQEEDSGPCSSILIP